VAMDTPTRLHGLTHASGTTSRHCTSAGFAPIWLMAALFWDNSWPA